MVAVPKLHTKNQKKEMSCIEIKCVNVVFGPIWALLVQFGPNEKFPKKSTKCAFKPV